MSWTDLLGAAHQIRQQAALAESSLAALRLEAIGWATVDADRAREDLVAVVGRDATWHPVERDSLLGASAWRCEPPPDARVALVLLEPDTEGLLAAFLARFGEGIAAVYLVGARGGDLVVPINPRWGPYAVVRGRSG